MLQWLLPHPAWVLVRSVISVGWTTTKRHRRLIESTNTAMVTLESLYTEGEEAVPEIGEAHVMVYQMMKKRIYISIFSFFFLY